MAGKILKSDFIEDVAIRDALDKVLKLLTEIEAKGKSIKINLDAVNSFKQAGDAANKNKENIQKLTVAEKEYNRLQTQLKASIERKNLATSKENIQLQKNRVAIQAVNAALRNQARAQLNVQGSMSRLIGSFKGLISSYLGLTALIIGVIRLFNEVFNLTRKLDTLDFSMRKVITSEYELAETQIFLADISVRYGGNVLSLTERYIKFRAAAIQSNMTSKDTIQIFGSMTKAAGVLGLRTDETAGIFLALEQMLSKGKVTTEELRRQLGERLPGAFGIMAKTLEVPLSQLDKMLRAGEVISNEVLPKFAVEVEKAYGIETVTKVDTLAAAQNRLKTAWIQFVDELNASPVFTKVLNAIAGGVNKLKGALTDTTEENTKSSKEIVNKIIEQSKAYSDYEERVAFINSSIEELERNANASKEKYYEEDLKRYGNLTGAAREAWRLITSLDESYGTSAEDAANKYFIFGEAVNTLRNNLNEFASLKNISLSDILKPEAINAAKKEFEDLSKITDPETLKIFQESIQTDVTKNFSTYYDWATAQIEKYKILYTDTSKELIKFEAEYGDNMTKEQAKINTQLVERKSALATALNNITLSLYDDGKGNKSKTKDDSLSILKANNKAELEEYNKFQQDILLGQRELAKQTIKDEFALNEELIRLDEANKQRLLNKEIQLQENVVSATVKGSKERATEEAKLIQLKAELAKQATDTYIEQDERRTKNEERLAKDRRDAASSDIDIQAIKDQTDELNNFNDKIKDIYSEKLLSKEDLDEKIRQAEEEHQKKMLLILLEAEKKKLEILGGTPDEIAKINKRIEEINAQLAGNEIDTTISIENRKRAERQKTKDLVLQFVNEAFNFTSSLFSRELEMNERRHERDVALAGDSTEAKIAADNKYEEEKAKIERKQAIAERAAALFNIAIATTQTVLALQLKLAEITAASTLNPFLLPLIPIVASQIPIAIGIGALQAGAVMAEPLPELAEGGTMVHAGLARVSEEGQELRVSKSGKVSLTPPTDSIMHLDQGDTIIPHAETQRILADAAMNNFVNDTVDMSSTNSYLKQIRDKGETTYANGYKYVNRKGLKGRYATRL